MRELFYLNLPDALASLNPAARLRRWLAGPTVRVGVWFVDREGVCYLPTRPVKLQGRPPCH